MLRDLQCGTYTWSNTSVKKKMGLSAEGPLVFTRCFGSSRNYGLSYRLNLVLSGFNLTGIFYGHVSNPQVSPSPCQLTVVVV